MVCVLCLFVCVCVSVCVSEIVFTHLPITLSTTKVKMETHARRNIFMRSKYDAKFFVSVELLFFFLLALQPPSGVVFYSPLGGFTLLACEVS